MREKILKMGRVNATIMLTIFTLAIVAGLDILLAQVLNHQFKQSEDLLRILIIGLVVAPIMFWYLAGLFAELEQKNKDMERLATYDSLTGLYKRHVFYNACKKLHNYSVRNKQAYCILAIDMDEFKKINEIHGHACGDKVLSFFGGIAQETVRDSDILARFAGEEFVFFLPNTNIQQAEILAARLCDRIKKKAVIWGNSYVKYTVSIGISSNKCEKNETLENVLKKADDALHIAKSKGGNLVEVYSRNSLTEEEHTK